MYHVLIPVDRDKNRALHQAKFVAEIPDAAENVEATVLYVTRPGEKSEAENADFSAVDAAVEAAKHLESADISVNRVVDDGSPAEQILRSANELGIDEIVVGGRKRSGVQKVLLGSTAQDVMLSAEQPVTITGSDVSFGDRTGRLLLPVDRTAERARHQAEYVANHPAVTSDTEVTVLYVFPHQDYKGAPPHEFEEVESAVEAAEYLETEGVTVNRVATGGEVARTILDSASDADVDWLVMGGRKRSGVQKVLLGSITQDVILSGERPVTITG